jgi:hypothetical protein
MLFRYDLFRKNLIDSFSLKSLPLLGLNTLICLSLLFLSWLSAYGIFNYCALCLHSVKFLWHNTVNNEFFTLLASPFCSDLGVVDGLGTLTCNYPESFTDASENLYYNVKNLISSFYSFFSYDNFFIKNRLVSEESSNHLASLNSQVVDSVNDCIENTNEIKRLSSEHQAELSDTFVCRHDKVHYNNGSPSHIQDTIKGVLSFRDSYNFSIGKLSNSFRMLHHFLFNIFINGNNLQ